MSDYRIEKVRRHVRVVLAGGERLCGDVFLQPAVRYRSGPELPVELLNTPEPFFPIAVTGGEPLLLSKDHVIRVDYDLDDADTHSDLDDFGVKLELTLTDGSVHSGSVRLEVRAERPRVLDFLNALEGRFLPLDGDNAVALINRAFIVQARERTDWNVL